MILTDGDLATVPQATGDEPVPPDRNRYLVDGEARVLCVECARQFDAELLVCGEDDCHCCETDEPCQKCGAGGLVPVIQLALM